MINENNTNHFKNELKNLKLLSLVDKLSVATVIDDVLKFDQGQFLANDYAIFTTKSNAGIWSEELEARLCLK